MNKEIHIAARKLPDGRLVIIYPLTFGRARLTVSTEQSVELSCYDDAW